jgi:hypothetical protein
MAISRLSMLQYYSAPVSSVIGHFVGHLPEHISRVRCLHGASQEAIDKLHGSTARHVVVISWK